METLYIGPTGSGKTTKLLEKYQELGEKTNRTEKCLVFLKNATSVSDWRDKVDLKIIGPMNVFTYFGFIQREITRYWPIVEDKLNRKREKIEPTFMNVETSHYLMSQLVEEAREKEGAFEAINATSQQIGVQLIDNLNHAAMNDLSLNQVKERLYRWAAGDADKARVYQESIKIMKEFRKEGVLARTLDYSLIIHLYNHFLLENEDYISELFERFDYLLVDNLETMVPTAQILTLKLMEKMEETYLTFNPEGGFTGFFGGNPQLAKKTFFPICDQVYLEESYTTSKQARQLANSLVKKVFEGQPMADNGFIKGEIHTDLRGDMLLEVGEKVTQLIDSGVNPSNIALIAPLVDKVLDFSLDRYFDERGYKLANMARSKRLLDEPYAQGLITLAFLVNPEWQINLNFSSLVQTLSLILKLDPVRSALLADEIFKNQMVLPDLDQLGMRDRLGFDNSDKYDLFKKWVEGKKTQELDMEHFFQLVFGELLAPLEPDEKDILACRQIINSVKKFKKVMDSYGEFDKRELGERFIDMVLNGTLAAEVLYRPPANEEKIILATPYTFLFSPFIEKVEYMFWLDAASENWFRSTTKELTNPYILSVEWQDDQEWNDEVDQQLRKEQLIDYVQSLLSKTTKGLYLANSYLNSRGWEQEGKLLEWIQSDPEVIAND